MLKNIRQSVQGDRTYIFHNPYLTVREDCHSHHSIIGTAQECMSKSLRRIIATQLKSGLDPRMAAFAGSRLRILSQHIIHMNLADIYTPSSIPLDYQAPGRRWRKANLHNIQEISENMRLELIHVVRPTAHNVATLRDQRTSFIHHDCPWIRMSVFHRPRACPGARSYCYVLQV